MICNKCGTQNNNDSKFCMGCGNALSAVQEPVVNNIPSQQVVNEPVMNSIPSQPVVNEPVMNSIPSQPVVNEPVMNSIPSQQVVNEPVMNSVPSQQVSNEQKNKKETNPINKKLLLIIGGSILLVVVAIILFLVFKEDKVSKKLSNIFDLDQPIPVYKDGGYVYIDTNGKTIKNIKYNKVSDFNGDYAYVELEDGTAALIDKNQNVKVTATSYYAMQYLSKYDKWLIDGVLYDSNLKAITDKSISLTYLEDGFFKYNNSDYTEYGIINSNGKKIYKDSCLINSLEINDSYSDEYYGIIETVCYENNVEVEKEYLISLQTGDILYENEYKAEHQNSYYAYTLQSTDDNMFYIVDDNYNRIKRLYLKNNAIAYSTSEVLYGLELYGTNYLELDYGYDYEEIGKEQRYYYYNLKTKELLTEEPELEDIDVKVEKDVTKRQIVSCSYGKGLIDDKNVIIPCIYNNIEYLSDNVYEFMKQQESMDLMIVEDDEEQLSIYDANSRKSIIIFEDSKNSEIDDYDNSLLIEQKIYINDSWYNGALSKIVVHNLLTQQKIVFDSSSTITIKSNYFIESKNGKKIYYNMDFEKIYTEE